MQPDQLKDKDLVLFVDQSGSMGKKDQTGGKSRWQAVAEGTIAIARKMTELDPDGITVYAFGDKHTRYNNVTDETKVEAIFKHEPGGGTNLTGVLTVAFNDYFARRDKNEAKAGGEIWLVVTDGEPDDKESVKVLIAENSAKLTKDEELGIQFVQVGDDETATTFLKELDDELQTKYGAKYDIVDTTPLSAVGSRTVAEVLASAISD